MKPNFKRTFALMFALIMILACMAACGPTVTEHVHTLTEVAATEARCERDGNIQYWKCSGCDKLFADAAGTEEITQAETVIPAAHKPEKVDAFTAETMFACDAIEYYHCTVCGKNFADEACTSELQAKDIYEQKTFLLTSAQVTVPESTSRVYASVQDNNYNLAVPTTQFALRIFLGWDIGDQDFATAAEEMAKNQLEFRLNLNIDMEGTLANSQWYHFKLGYDADGAFGGFSDSDAFVHFNLLSDGGVAIEEAFLENAGVYVTLVRDGGWMTAYVEDTDGNLFELARTNCFGDTAMSRISLGVNQGYVASATNPAIARDGKLVLGTTEAAAPQTAEEDPGDIIDTPSTPVRVLSIGTPYDPNVKLGWGEAAYNVEEKDGETVISWADGRGPWAKIWQDVSGYAAEEGSFVKVTFSVERTTDVYILYVADTTGAGETQMHRADYDAGEHTVYFPLYEEAASSFIIEYYLDAKEPAVKAGSITISEVSFVKEVSIGTMYDNSSSPAVGMEQSYAVETVDGNTVVSWEEGRPQWDYVNQEFTGYIADVSGRYLHLAFTAEPNVKIGVYLNGNAIQDHTVFEAGSHDVYIALPDGLAENFTLNYYFNADAAVAAGKVTFTAIEIVAEPENVETGANIGTPYDPNAKFGWGAAAYAIEENGGEVAINWTTSRDVWAKVWQDVSGYSAEEGGYLKMTFTVDQKTNVYVCYVADTTGAGETQMHRADYEAGEHTIYFAIKDGAASNFIIEYYFDAGVQSTGSIVLKEVSVVAEIPAE